MTMVASRRLLQSGHFKHASCHSFDAHTTFSLAYTVFWHRAHFGLPPPNLGTLAGLFSNRDSSFSKLLILGRNNQFFPHICLPGICHQPPCSVAGDVIQSQLGAVICLVTSLFERRYCLISSSVLLTSVKSGCISLQETSRDDFCCGSFKSSPPSNFHLLRELEPIFNS